MKHDEAMTLIREYARPYRSASEGVLVSAVLFALVPPRDAGPLFDALLEYAERVIGREVDIAKAPKGWVRIVPKQNQTTLVAV